MKQPTQDSQEQSETTENKGGRPRLYDPKYCQMLVDHMAKGYSFETFGAIAGICRATLYNWLRDYYEFKGAKEKAMVLSLQFWESLIVEHYSNPKGGTKGFHFGLWKFIMQCRFPELYGDRRMQKEEEQEDKKLPKRESTIILSNGTRIAI